MYGYELSLEYALIIAEVLTESYKFESFLSESEKYNNSFDEVSDFIHRGYCWTY